MLLADPQPSESFDTDAVTPVSIAPPRYIIYYKNNGHDNVLSKAKFGGAVVKEQFEEFNAVVVEFPDEVAAKTFQSVKHDEVEFMELDPPRFLMAGATSDEGQTLGRAYLRGSKADAETQPSAPMRQTQARRKYPLYGLNMIGAHAAQRMAPSQTANVPVCIMDTGYTPNHIDLPGTPFAVGDPSPVESCAVPCCCNSFNQCSACSGSFCSCGAGQYRQTCVSTTGCAALNPFQDGLGHGTHVAGTILALENGGGIVGVCPTCKPLVVRVFDNQGGFTYASGVAAAALKCQSLGAKVINMSLGGPMSTQLEAATFSRLQAAGVLSIAAIGNNPGARMSYPAGYSSVMGVAAVGSNRRRAHFSEYNHAVDITAPGVQILSSYPPGRSSFGFAATMEVSSEGGIATVSTKSAGMFAGSAVGQLPSTGVCVIEGNELATAADNCRGKVCLMANGPGMYSAEEKVDACKDQFGVGAILYGSPDEDLTSSSSPSRDVVISQEEEDVVFVLSLSTTEGEMLASAARTGSLSVSLKVEETESTFVEGAEAGEANKAPRQVSSYKYEDGTSMAAPHVAGAAGLLLAKHPQCSTETVKQALLASARPLPAGAAGGCPSGVPASYCHGRGLLDVYGAMRHLCSSSFCANRTVCAEIEGRRVKPPLHK
uniref:subtilisin n=1 Tax=Chromera velia CCMP2878 TaxID=1169474 RepID=A0A0G4I0F0_9ALVE|eukprot:Cvel_9933.t1-p1 / transcript=Cvel_9933.t1 / gene=Cvel_9933 / organism=Chromera_velia_CCMP2878 / gene_product=Subtilisin DY, putative / transcript_product=Subtilisin DY, putative / location=Cvel_scaffold587:39873-42885(+) / protein_length=656 / sequence_SO=supercontig / SO=protein_coding / is_pseudo=false